MYSRIFSIILLTVFYSTQSYAFTSPKSLNSNAFFDTGNDLSPQITTDGLGT